MKKYIAPELKTMVFDACDIIQTSGEEVTTASMPKTVISGTTTEATAAATTSYSEVSSILE